MSFSNTSAWLGSAALAGVLAMPCYAQTPIGDILALAEENGGTVEFADQITGGGATEWRDLVITGPDADLIIEIPWVKEMEAGGGDTEVTLAPEAFMTFFDDGAEIGKVKVTNAGLTYRVEEAGAGTRHVYMAESLAVSRVSGEILQALDVAFTEVSGFYAMQMDTDIDTSGAFNAAGARLMYAFEVPEATSATDYVIDGFDVNWAFAGPVADPDTLESFAPYSGALKMVAGATSGSASFGQGAEEMDIAFSGGASVTDITLGSGRVDYDVEAGAFQYNIKASGMGFPPVDLSADRIAMNLGAPITVLDAHDGMDLGLAFENLAVGEGLWNLFDPQATLPRDPVNLIIDLAGQMKWNVEPPQADSYPGIPVDVSRVDVNEITIQAAGAEILANGGADVIMNGPIPAGDGVLKITINGLMDLSGKLATLGLLQPEMVMGARGMIGAFATPTGPDGFESEIVFSPDGSISANGIPLPIR